MRLVCFAPFLAAILLVAPGCGQKKTFDGPTVEAFNGRVVAGGKPVNFPPGEQISLKLLHQESGKSWGIPLQTDGTFNIGWMPIGKYSMMMTRPPVGNRSGPRVYVVPTQFEIVDGQTQYTIDLGKDFKP